MDARVWRIMVAVSISLLVTTTQAAPPSRSSRAFDFWHKSKLKTESQKRTHIAAGPEQNLRNPDSLRTLDRSKNEPPLDTESEPSRHPIRSISRTSDVGSSPVADANPTAQQQEPGVDEAETPEDSDEDVSAEEGPPATLFGERWHTLGPFSAEYLYTGEVFNNARGGKSTKGATRYRGNLDLTLKFDTELADWWQGGEFSVYMQQNHGRTLTQDFVGDGQYYSSIDTGLVQDFTQLGEYWYRHSFADDLLIVKMGRQDANENFAFADLGGDFINSSFITLANIPMPTWPYQTLGVSALYQPSSQVRWGGGVYDQGADHGQWWSNTTSRGLFFIGQMDYQPFADDDDALLTLIRVGGWCTGSDTVSLIGPSSFDNNYGFFTTIDQMLLVEQDDAEQGLGTFLQFSWAPPDRNQLDISYGGGLVYRGLLPGHDSDTLGLGFTLIDFSSAVSGATGQTNENAVELFYKARIREWMSIQPDMQYIARPSGIGRDALVTGLRCEITF